MGLEFRAKYGKIFSFTCVAEDSEILLKFIVYGKTFYLVCKLFVDLFSVEILDFLESFKALLTSWYKNNLDISQSNWI